MKILHVTNYGNGGAGIAAYRLHMALREEGIDSRMLVRTKGSEDPFVSEVGGRILEVSSSSPYAPCLLLCCRLAVRARGWLGSKLTKVLGMEGCSLNIFPTGLHKVLNASDADLIHLHWINNEMISINEIAKIKKPLVWTLHDCWPLLGAEHHSYSDYWMLNHEAHEKENLNNSPFFMLHAPCSMLSNVINNWIFKKKQKAWRNLKVSFVAPSNWMAEQVRKSKLFSDAPVAVIPNCLDLDVFRPMDQSACRRKWNLPLDKTLVLFGAHNPQDPNKGLDLLENALRKLSDEIRDRAGVVVFGCKEIQQIGGLPTYWIGTLATPLEMAELYNVADVVCVPSRKESFGLIAAEAGACGVPVVAFRCTGLVDLVVDKETGCLAEPYKTESLAAGLEYAVLNSDMLSARARGWVEEKFSARQVSRVFQNWYEEYFSKKQVMLRKNSALRI